VASWWITDWRLYGWLLALAFDWHDSAQVTNWAREITLRPLDTLKRMLLELPTRGRAPITVPEAPAIPALYIWGRHDALVLLPRHPRPNDVFVSAGHSAPTVDPRGVAAAALPFLEQHPDRLGGAASASISLYHSAPAIPDDSGADAR
jgi:pimeloyl-ACP methyl ester carboxylesterase